MFNSGNFENLRTKRVKNRPFPKQLAEVNHPFEVSENLYRSALPKSKEEFKILENKYGINTVVSLRSGQNKDLDSKIAGMDSSLKFKHFEMGYNFIAEKDIIEFLKLFKDENHHKQPVLVHCKHGADRTGAAVAAYRVCVQGWMDQKTRLSMT
ncbi:MAG: dual specificity protein phosphatase family protein [Desulfobacteraceae bacterium]|nr:dual specificity protein phosphatase family protein [Desulfobacteraceae bacterium]